MESNKRPLCFINSCSSILRYKANEKMSLSTAFNYVELNEKCYYVLVNGEKVQENYQIKKDDELIFFKNLSKSLEILIKN
jgi:hypothetical protein